VVNHVLSSLGADTQPRIEVLNKWDLVGRDAMPELPGALQVSAHTGEGMEELLQAISATLRTQETSVQVLVPFADYGALHELRSVGRLENEEHLDSGTLVTVAGPVQGIHRVLAKYQLNQATQE
jgi:GTP-binding protein HflX